MFKQRFILGSALAFMLTACGGDGGGSVTGNNGASGSGGKQTVDDGKGGKVTVSKNPTVKTPALGTGSGDSFTTGALTISSTTLSAGGTANVSANIVDAGNGNALVKKKYRVSFGSTCADRDPARAEFSKKSLDVSSGNVSVTYKAKGCSGTDVVTFKLYEASGTDSTDGEVLALATGNIKVAPPEVGTIDFVELTNPAMSMQKIANKVLPSSTSVSFAVRDKNANPIEGKTVEFELSNTAGGIELATSSAITNESGVATVIVTPGTTHAITRVKATTLSSDGSTKIFTSSLPISITTGLADQESFDMSADVFNPGAYDVNNVEVKVTVNAADHFNNPVPDGTIINFTAESGLIPSSCQTEGGVCTVSWKSSGTIPGEHAPGLGRVNEEENGQTIKGMTTILAYTEGESDFSDKNSNGLFDDGESFTAFGEAFRDDNNDGIYTPNSEDHFDIKNVGTRDGAPTKYQGSLCSESAKDKGHCAELMHVRDSLRIVQSVVKSPFSISLFDSSGNVVSSPINVNKLNGNITVVVRDVNGNIPPAGTSVSFSADGYNISGDSGDVPNSTGFLGTVAAGMPKRGAKYDIGLKVDSLETIPTSCNQKKTTFEVSVSLKSGSVQKSAFCILPYGKASALSGVRALLFKTDGTAITNTSGLDASDLNNEFIVILQGENNTPPPSGITLSFNSLVTSTTPSDTTFVPNPVGAMPTIGARYNVTINTPNSLTAACSDFIISATDSNVNPAVTQVVQTRCMKQ